MKDAAKGDIWEHVPHSGTFKPQTIKCDVTVGEDRVWSDIQALKSKYGTEDDMVHISL